MIDELSTRIPIIPLAPRSKRPLLAWSKRRGVLATPAELAAWRREGCNFAAICGPAIDGNGALVVVDADNVATARMVLDDLMAPTLLVRSRRGLHCWLWLDDALPTVHVLGLDIIGNGLALLPGCIHPSGHIYAPLLDMPIARVRQLADALPSLASAIAWPRYDAWRRMGTPSAQPAIDNEPARPLTLAHLIAHLRAAGAAPSSVDGRYWMACCPWHDDRKPSLSIDLMTQRVHCFACGCRATIAVWLRVVQG